LIAVSFSLCLVLFVSLQKYIEALFFQTDLTASHLSEIVYVSEAYVSTGLISTLYINILLFFFLRSSGTLDAFLVRKNSCLRVEHFFEFLAPMSLLQLTSDPK